MEKDQKNNIVKAEEEILDFWEENKVFEESIARRQGQPLFSFYDGPPFATGQPHYGNLLPSTIKDVVLRYQTMRGRYAPRWVGWDCHGLPLENLAEQELNQKSKADIEKLGIDKFNQTCRKLVFRYLDDFKQTLKRLGRWADYENRYATVDSNYTESIWWLFKHLYEKGLVYQDYRTAPYCPRCETPLSNFELNQPGAYRDIKDLSVFVKFPLLDEKETYLLVWTTTPWTLPANFAVAVNPDIDYVKIKTKSEKLILAQSRLSEIQEQFSREETFSGQQLIDRAYSPLYNLPPSNGRDYRVVKADFVSTEEGTGLVHLAAFGLEDMEVAKEQNLPLKITVDQTGRMATGYSLPGEGLPVWQADKEILNDLQKRRLLYRTLEIEHSYPFCWRCDQRLIYYPITSWYIAVEKFRDQLVANNQQINWVPGHLKNGRFGKWLEGARDWGVSRNRYWGAPIPVWQSESGETVVIGSREDLRQQNFSSNRYWLMRHGEAESNVQGVLVDSQNGFSLTDLGRQQVQITAEKLKKTAKIDVILSSDVARARETAEIVGQVLGVEPQYYPELGEHQFGVFNEKPSAEYRQFFKSPEEFLTRAPEGGETGLEVRQRVYRFIEEQDAKYQGMNILVVGHRGPLRHLESACLGLTEEEQTARRSELGLDLAEFREMKFAKMPFNEEGRLDFHRPYIDTIEFKSPSGEKMKRVEEVFDCWYESGAMPYAQFHYPFENQEKMKNFFPADFITEALEQTRGWFYTLHVLATALTLEEDGLGVHQPAFKNVIAHGLILTEAGDKLSKHVKNYQPPQIMFDRYGADALRFYLLNQSTLGGNYVFSEDKVKESMQKIVSTLDNCATFYLTYAPSTECGQGLPVRLDLLDRWMISRLHETGQKVIQEMDNFRVDRAVRQFVDLIDDFSNWYIRRSRSRLQTPGPETKEAAQVLRYLLHGIINLMAPFTPFISEKIYRSLNVNSELLSVHLEDYFQPQPELVDNNLEGEMARVRQIVRLALQARAKSGLRVRQPLAELRVQGSTLKNNDLVDLIIQEINVRQLFFVDQIKESPDWIRVEEGELVLALDTRLSEELKEEGRVREVIRTIKTLRKQAGLQPTDKIKILYRGSEELVALLERSRSVIAKESRADEISLLNKEELIADQEIVIDDQKLLLAIAKKDVSERKD